MKPKDNVQDLLPVNSESDVDSLENSNNEMLQESGSSGCGSDVEEEEEGCYGSDEPENEGSGSGEESDSGSGSWDYNNYTEEEYNEMLRNGTWHGGYVNGVYVIPQVTEEENRNTDGGGGGNSGGTSSGGNSGGSAGTTPNTGNGQPNPNNNNNGNPNLEEDENTSTADDSIQAILHYAIDCFNNAIPCAMDLLSNLISADRVRIATPNTKHPNSIYDQDEGRMYIIETDYGDGLIHEFLHYLQDEANILDYNNSRLNNEYQADILTNLLSHQKFGTVGYEEKYGLSESDYATLCTLASSGFTTDDLGNYYVSQNLISFLDSHISNDNTDSYRSSIQQYVPLQANPNYQWQWYNLFRQMGFKIR